MELEYSYLYYLSLCYILYRIIIDCKSYDLQSYILSNTSINDINTSISTIEDVTSKFTLSISSDTVNVSNFVIYKYAKFLYISWYISLKTAISARTTIPFTLSNSLGISKLYCQNGALYVNGGVACGTVAISETGEGWYMNTGNFNWDTSIMNIQVRMFALYE